MKEIKQNSTKLNKLFTNYNIAPAYLFGSQAQNKTTSLCDVDIAVLFNDQVGIDKYGDSQISLISDLMLIFKRSDIDVAILNRAPPLMKFLVAGQGELIFKINDMARVKFVVTARREYFDTGPIRRVQNRALSKRYSSQDI